MALRANSFSADERLKFLEQWVMQHEAEHAREAVKKRELRPRTDFEQDCVEAITWITRPGRNRRIEAENNKLRAYDDEVPGNFESANVAELVSKLPKT